MKRFTSPKDSTLQKIFRRRLALLEVDHAATELVLTRLCADVGMLTYHLRLNGDRVSDDALRNHDLSLRRSVDAILGGGLTDEAWEQATLAVKSSGLGFREARSIAIPAFVSSRVASRPHVEALAQHLEEAEITTAAAVLAKYDARTDAALASLVSTLDSDTGSDLIHTLSECANGAAERWKALFELGEADSSGDDWAEQRPRRPGVGVGLLPDDEDEDDEHPDATANSKRAQIQKLIMMQLDKRHVASVEQGMRACGDRAGLNRMMDLQHKEQDHSWLWALSKHRGPVMDNEVYVEAIRVRLGIAGPLDVVPCGLCGELSSAGSGAHALCCARAESTRGHNQVTRQVFDEVSAIDASAELEPLGLIPTTLLRPADVLTGALGHGLVALDVGIASPDASGAGEDCVMTMHRNKVDKYAPHQDALERQNIQYEPLVFSCYGRPHSSTTAILRTLAKRIARRRGCSAGEWRFRRLRAKLVTKVWARAGSMVQACWPDRFENEDEIDGSMEPT